MSVDYSGGVDPQDNRRMYVRQLLAVYTPKVIDGCMSVNYSGGVDPQNNWRMYGRQLFLGFTPPK